MKHIRFCRSQKARLLCAGLCAILLMAAHTARSMMPETIITDRDSIARAMRAMLHEELMRWYPACVDSEQGGYLSDFDEAWRPEGRQDKMIVTQSRHIWSAANASEFDAIYLPLIGTAEHGAQFLKTVMWDSAAGGFYDLVDRRGRPLKEDGRIIKRAYGNAFAIYGLARGFRASHDSSMLALARQAFRWLDRHSWDRKYGGYFQFMNRNGSPFMNGYKGTPPKDYNSLIHLLESFTELYRVWPDRLVRDRLASLLAIVRDTLASHEGSLRLYFTRAWKHVKAPSNAELDHISFGHDVETAYLLLEASEALGGTRDSVTLSVAKKMVDRALAYGIDPVNGGLFDAAAREADPSKEPVIIKRTKEWWAQAEAFHAFLLMSDLFPDDGHRYYDRFCEQWNYCMRYVIDHERGGWYWGGIDIAPDNVHSPKGTIWKGSYHTSRALINSIGRLRAKGGSSLR